ncbi:polysaccharide biosynthesis/export family protein [Frigidibacter sp. MR17.24]|uniref:polysaccharide biosynthesis/export family protein n=1 Tax=Frigidibacter sp. MR17.24 TaxID=3127345 RepID=UPI0030131637
MFRFLGFVPVLIACAALPACASLPRGAGSPAMILETARAQGSGISVIPVTRRNVAQLNGRAGGGRLAHGWLAGGAPDPAGTIRPGDRLNVAIWDTATDTLLTETGAKSALLTGLEVDAGGRIAVPYAGRIGVGGDSVERARATILESLAPSMPTAEVQLQRLPGRLTSVSLVSGVPQPGSVPLEAAGLSTLGLISQGGGISTGLRHPVVRVMRGDGVYETWAEDLLAGRSADAWLRGGDRVMVVEDERSFTAIGATGTEQVVPFDESEITAMTALAMAGGLNESRADLKGILVLRGAPAAAPGQGEGDAIYVLDLTGADGLFAARAFGIRPGDTVMATESPVVSAQTVLGLAGLLLRTGTAAGVSP